RSGAIAGLGQAECEFSYRESRFKRREPERYVVLAVTFRLTRGGAAAVRYRDVAETLARQGVAAPSLADVRRAVLEIRRAKSMVLDAGDPNRRSCGSFFVNPIVSAAESARIAERAGPAMPRWPEADSRVKLSAAWLIERAGLPRGHCEG